MELATGKFIFLKLQIATCNSQLSTFKLVNHKKVSSYIFKLIKKITKYHTCLNKKLINQLWLLTPSSQYCPIDDSQNREGTTFIPYSLAVQAAQKCSDF